MFSSCFPFTFILAETMPKDSTKVVVAKKTTGVKKPVVKKAKVPKKVVLPKSKTLRVKIYSSPTGAKVYVKNRLIGKTPFSLSKKDKKTVKYIAKLKGFRDQVFTISHQKVKRIRLKSVF